MSGFLLIDKPPSWTSHDVVAYIRRIARQHDSRVKVGHAGTLDPFATGLLIVGVGREATKQIDIFKRLSKEYVATVCLHATSDTQDCTGSIVASPDHLRVTKKMIEDVLPQFVGEQLQTPPMFSAKKVHGKKLYELARQGKEITREPVRITIFDITLLNVEEETQGVTACTMRISCAAGTYIRTLAHDIGAALGTGAYCEALRRTKIGDYRVEDAHTPEEIDGEHIEEMVI